MIVDTHCHLAAQEFEPDLLQTLARARQEGVEKIVVVGTDPDNSAKSLEIARANPGFGSTAGVHPHDASKFLEPAAWKSFETLASVGFNGIGETGLDFYYNHSPRELQIECLKRHVELSLRLKLPLVLHCRDAYQELADCLRELGKGKAFGVIHCFTGNAPQAKTFLDLGFHISFSGIITFPKADILREACKIVPQEKLLVETDAPYLAPVPQRGKRNEPAFARLTLEYMAKLRGEETKKLAEVTSRNACQLFRL